MTTSAEQHPVLMLALQAAVPLEIHTLAGAAAGDRRRAATGWAQTIAAHGDDLMYGGKDCASAFAALARGLAALAYQPGGVSFAGRHWCVGSKHNGTHDEAPCAAEIAREATGTKESEAQR